MSHSSAEPTESSFPAAPEQIHPAAFAVDEATNPFSARFIQPGVISYIFPEGESLETMMSRFEAAGRRGEIIGPHGTGKSTLIAAMQQMLERNGNDLCVMTLHNGEHRLPFAPSKLPIGDETILVVDGFEQLSWWSRRVLFQLCGRRRRGILVTAHTPTGLPTLFETMMSPAIGMRVILELLDGVGAAVEHSDRSPLAVSRTFDSLRRHDGNLRETLFELYDDYEAFRRPPE